jgi:hypothetical protein
MGKRRECPFWPSVETNMANPTFVLELPSENEIECIEEIMVPQATGVIKRTIHYKNGLVAVLHTDFRDSIFSIYLKSENDSTYFWKRQNQIFVVP